MLKNYGNLKMQTQMIYITTHNNTPSVVNTLVCTSFRLAESENQKHELEIFTEAVRNNDYGIRIINKAIVEQKIGNQ